MNNVQKQRRIKDSRVKVEGYDHYYKSNGKTSCVVHHFASRKYVSNSNGYRYDLDVMGRMRRTSRRKQCRKDWDLTKPNQHVVYFQRSKDARASFEATLHEKVFRERDDD